MMSPHSEIFLKAISTVCDNMIGGIQIDLMVKNLVDLRERGGRLFIVGIGGSAANASHAVNDFRKLCHIEAYCATDNVAELTARTNDEGWDTAFSGWLDISSFGAEDTLLVLSVGGGSKEQNVSWPLIRAIDLAIQRGAGIIGIVGKADGYAAKMGHVVIVIQDSWPGWITPITESMQSVILHCLVSHPLLQQRATKW